MRRAKFQVGLRGRIEVEENTNANNRRWDTRWRKYGIRPQSQKCNDWCWRKCAWDEAGWAIRTLKLWSSNSTATGRSNIKEVGDRYTVEGPQNRTKLDCKEQEWCKWWWQRCSRKATESRLVLKGLGAGLRRAGKVCWILMPKIAATMEVQQKRAAGSKDGYADKIR